MRSEDGRYFKQFLDREGANAINIRAIASGNLGDHNLAALLSYGENKQYTDGVLIADKDLREKVKGFEKQYQLQSGSGILYVLLHELGHAAGLHTEKEAEHFVVKAAEYIASKTQDPQKREMYQRIIEAAKQRKEQTRENLEHHPEMYKEGDARNYNPYTENSPRVLSPKGKARKESVEEGPNNPAVAALQRSGYMSSYAGTREMRGQRDRAIPRSYVPKCLKFSIFL